MVSRSATRKEKQRQEKEANQEATGSGSDDKHRQEEADKKSAANRDRATAASSSSSSAEAAEASGGKMSEEEKKTRASYLELCRELNMDMATAESAWSSYQAIGQNYTLEGNQLHWLACALYVACRDSTLPTVGRGTAHMVEGNGVSLARLLRSFSLSLIQFFNKAKKWADMSNLKSGFRDKVDSLERNFAVSNVIFKKYQPIFVNLFKDPAKDPPKVNRSRKQKKPPCTPGEVFDFCWGLFVRVKTDFPPISDDLVNSYHLLLSCVDYIYGNAVLARRTDLLNESFLESHPQEMPADQGEDDAPVEPPCILDFLCHVHDGINSEVKSIREHWFKPKIKKFFEEKKLLRGDLTNLSGVLDPIHFEVNAKSIRKDYEEHVLEYGEYDERVFLGEDANEEIGTPTKLSAGGAVAAHGDAGATSGGGGDGTGGSGILGEKMLARRNLSTQFDGSSLIATTPLSGKHYLRAKEQLKITPVSTATYLVSRLNSLLGRREPEPGPKLLELLASCSDGEGGETAKSSAASAIEARVKEMGDKFCSHYVAPSEKHPGSHDSFARMRLRMGVVLYYKLLEAILTREKAQSKPLGNLIRQDVFHDALFSCCLEIVIFSYNSQRTFPWILDIFRLEPVHFYKVIEVIIRTEDSLPRDVVKHLQRIEEQILESRAWASGSPLWEAISRDPQGVPTCEEVSLPGHPAAEPHVEPVPGQSPLSHHKRPFSIVKSPMAGDRFKSPVVTAVARRQLAFDSNVAPSAGSQIIPTSPVKQSLLSSPQKTFIQVQGQNLPITGVKPLGDGKVVIQTQEQDQTAASSDKPRGPKRTGSLALLFRKVYHLAHLRLDALCQSLQIVDEDTKRKIWTTFENTMTRHTDLMRDRHLDQLIMCSLYIVCKVVGQNKNFTDIMKQYRTQPQAASHVYRSVLLRTKAADTEGGEEAVTKKKASYDKENPPPTPTRLAATSTIVDGEERGDLIKFYNTVFMERLQEFSLKFKRSRQSEAPPLSPLPKLRAHPQSPCRKVSENHSVYIRPLKSSSGDVVSYNPQSPHKPLQYSFSRSPAKNLDAINQLMRTEGERRSAVGKRLLADDGAPAATTIPVVVGEQQLQQQQQPETQMVIIQQEGGEPPTKVQIIGQTAGKLNSRLGIVLGDRSLSE